MGLFDGKTALVTGGTSGIGLAAARRLAAEGAHVFVTGRRQPAIDAAVTAIGPNATGLRGDSARLDDLDRIFAAVRDSGRGLDILLANAGGGEFAALGDITWEHYADTFNANVGGTLFTVQKALPLLNPGASVIVTSSNIDVKGAAAFSVYAASKAALRSMTRSLARELLDRKIRVNAVSPGPIDTGILRRSMPADAARRLEAQFVARNPMGRMGEPTEVAKAVLFLAFDATYTTGAELVVDGGASQL